MAARWRQRELLLEAALQCRMVQKRGVKRGPKWPKEYSRKKWFMGPPKLPSDIAAWMKREEDEKEELLEELRTDILPPPPAFRGTSHIGVTFLPDIGKELPGLVGKESSSEQKVEDGEETTMEMCSVDECIAYYRECRRRGVVPSKKIGPKMSFKMYVYLVEQCADERDLARGKWAHAHALSHGRAKNRYLNNFFMIMYMKCGCVDEVQQVFDEIITRNVHSWTILIRAYALFSGRHHEALTKFRYMLLESDESPNVTCISTVLTVCAKIGGSLGLKEGRRIHQTFAHTRIIRSTVVGNSLINLYTKAGCIDDAYKAFKKTTVKDTISWNSILKVYAKNGQTTVVLQLFAAMEVEGREPDVITFKAILEALREEKYLDLGRGLHERMIRTVFDSLDAVSDTALVRMYARCGSIEEAELYFEQMPVKDMVAWSSMVGTYAQVGYPVEALYTFRLMQLQGYKANWITFTSLVDACSNLGNAEMGKNIQAWIAEIGQTMPPLQNALVLLFGKHGSVLDAIRTFEGISEKTTMSWNAMISSLAGRGLVKEALQVLGEMLWEGVDVDRVTMLTALEAGSQIGDLRRAEKLHSIVLETGLLSKDVAVANTTINMYAKCGGVEQAKGMLDCIPEKDLVSWNAMLSAFSKHGRRKEAFELVRNMDLEGFRPDRVTFINLVDSCTNLQDVRMVHSRVERCFGDDLPLRTALIEQYGRFGSLEEAKMVFVRMNERDVVAWAAMLGALVGNGDGVSALEVGRLMDLNGIEPNNASLVHLLEACKLMEDVESGKLIHEKMGWSFEKLGIILETALFDMYARCGDMEEARAAFEAMSSRPLVAWNGMFSACVRRGFPSEAFKFAEKMDLEGVKPDKFTFGSLLEASATLRHRVQATLSKLVECGLERDAFVGTVISNMFAKCGDLEKSRSAFDELDEKSDVSWSVIVGAYAQAGDTDDALTLLTKMEHEGLTPSAATFMGVLCACSHSGLLENGSKCFSSMVHDHHLQPEALHLNVMVDLLGRAGWLHEAERLILSFPQARNDPVAWSSLLGCCKTHGHLQLAEAAAKEISRLDPTSAANYLVLSSMYASQSKNYEQNAEVLFGSKKAEEKSQITSE